MKSVLSSKVCSFVAGVVEMIIRANVTLIHVERHLSYEIVFISGSKLVMENTPEDFTRLVLFLGEPFLSSSQIVINLF